MVYMNLEGNWSLATPLTGLDCAWSYYEIFLAQFTNFLNQKITGQYILKNCVIYTFKYLLAATIFWPPGGP